MWEVEEMLSDPQKILSELQKASKEAPLEQAQEIDLNQLAEKIVEKMLQELSIENERMGYG
jgi:predicted KAP-like P-loop ATPase